MITIKCPKCDKDTSFNLSSSVSEDGEVYMCEHCGYLFRYANER